MIPKFVRQHSQVFAYVCFLILGVAYSLPGFLGKVLWGHDTSKITFPFSYFLDQSLKSGTLHTWNPYIYFGFPLGSEQGQYGIAYPLNLLHAILPITLALTILLIIHISLAGYGTYLFARAYKLRHIAAITAGISYMFNGFIIAHNQYPSHFYAYAWLPFIFLMINSGALKGNIKYFLLAGTFMGLQALSGHPNIFFISLIGSAIYLVLLHIPSLKRIISAGLGMGIAAAVTALPYLWQLRTLLPLSNRASGVDFLDATNSSVHFLDLINFVSPHFFFGDLSQSWHYAQNWHRFGYWGQIETSGFVGIITLVLGLFSIYKKRLSQTLPILCILGVSLLIAFGRNTPLYENIFFRLPILNGLRAPGKFLLLTDFCLAVLAAFGFNRLLTQVSKGLYKRFWYVYVIVGAALASLLSLYFSRSLRQSVLVPLIASVYAKDGFFAEGEKISQFVDISVKLHIVFPLVCLIAASCILGLYLLFRNKWLMLLIPALLVTEFVYFIKPINVWMPWENLLHNQNQTIRQLVTGLPSTYRVYTYTNFWSDLLPNQLVPHHIREANGFSSLYLNRYSEWQEAMSQSDSDALFRMASVKYAYTDKGLREIPDPLPRAYLSYAWLSFADENKVFSTLSDAGYNPEVPIIESSENSQTVAQKPIQEVSIEHDGYEKLSMAASADSPALLVLQDTFYPGWHAYIDRVEVPIYKANYLFRGIFVPAGLHTVNFVYKPDRWMLTLSLSWTWITICLVLFKRQLATVTYDK